jgi:hypothetical protein
MKILKVGNRTITLTDEQWKHEVEMNKKSFDALYPIKELKEKLIQMYCDILIPETKPK